MRSTVLIFQCLPNDSPILRECDSRPCGRGGTCEIGAQGYRCRCKDGFRLNRGTCRDINECAARIDKCHDDAVCENNTGGYACRCPSGFGDGISSCVEERSKAPVQHNDSFIGKEKYTGIVIW